MTRRKARRTHYTNDPHEPLIRAEDEGCFGFCNTCCRHIRKNRPASYCAWFNLCLYFLILGLSGLLTFLLLKRDVPLFKFGKDEKCDVSNSSSTSSLVVTTTTITPTFAAPIIASSSAATATSASSSTISHSPFVRLIFLSSNALHQGQYALTMYILENFNWYGQPASEIVCLRDLHISEADGKCMHKTALKFKGDYEQCKCECHRFECATFSHQGSECQVHTSPCVPQPSTDWKTFTIDGLKFLEMEAVAPPTQQSLPTTSSPAASSAAESSSTAATEALASSSSAATEAPASSSSAATDAPASSSPAATEAPASSSAAATEAPASSSSSAESSSPAASSAAPADSTQAATTQGASQEAESTAAPADSTQAATQTGGAATTGAIPDVEIDDEDLDGLDDLDELVETTGGATQPAATQNPPTEPSQPAPTQAAANENQPIPPQAEVGVHRRLLGVMDGDMAQTALTFFFDSYWTNKVALPAGSPPGGLPSTIFFQMIRDICEELRLRIPNDGELKQIETVFDVNHNGFISFNEFRAPLSPILRRELGLPMDSQVSKQ